MDDFSVFVDNGMNGERKDKYLMLVEKKNE